MVVDSSQSQRGPGELEGFEVEGGACSSLAFDGSLVSGPLTGGGAVENPHGVEGQAVENLNAAIMKRQSQA